MLVRLSTEDRLLLEARAEARGMRPATYVAVLTRAHLRALAPLPKDELLALRRAIGELAAIGRNINQIAKAANDSGRLPGSAREEFRAMLKVCEALRDSTKTLLKANVVSWSVGRSRLIARAEAGVELSRGWDINAYVDNLTDNYAGSEDPSGVPSWVARPRPRTYGLQAEYKFR